MAAKKNTARSARIKSTPARSARKGPAKGKNAPARRAAIAQIPNDQAARPMTPELTEERIAKRAYEIWQCNGGSEFDNWTAAENELLAA